MKQFVEKLEDIPRGTMITHSRNLINVLDIFDDANHIDINDIAYHLGHRFRWNGACDMTVAEHSVRVAQHIDVNYPWLKLMALLHEGDEVYLPDFIRPISDLIPNIMNELRRQHKQAVWDRFCPEIKDWEGSEEIIKKYDDIELEWEWENIIKSKKHQPLSPDDATNEFKIHFNNIFGEVVHIIRLKGRMYDRMVWLNGEPLSPAESQKVRNHSPDGFNWGYAGSGPAQLALAICMKLWPGSEGGTDVNYQKFKFAVIGGIPQNDFDLILNLNKYNYL